MQYHCICLRQTVTVARHVADFCLWDEVLERAADPDDPRRRGREAYITYAGRPVHSALLFQSVFARSGSSDSRLGAFSLPPTV